MDLINTIINMVTRNCFMATIDLKDAYYSVAISRLFQKFLKFKWKETLYCFTCFPNGLGSCPWVFSLSENDHYTYRRKEGKTKNVLNLLRIEKPTIRYLAKTYCVALN